MLCLSTNGSYTGLAVWQWAVSMLCLSDKRQVSMLCPSRQWAPHVAYQAVGTYQALISGDGQSLSLPIRVHGQSLCSAYQPWAIIRLCPSCIGELPCTANQHHIIQTAPNAGPNTGKGTIAVRRPASSCSNTSKGRCVLLQEQRPFSGFMHCIALHAAVVPTGATTQLTSTATCNAAHLTNTDATLLPQLIQDMQHSTVAV